MAKDLAQIIIVEQKRASVWKRNMLVKMYEILKDI